MILISFILALSAFAGAATPSPFTPSGNYTPSFVQCPSNTAFVRPASKGLAQGEQAWLQKRKSNIVPALKQYLHTANIDGFDVDSFISCIDEDRDSGVPVIGFTLSGGGTRAQISGLGLYQAMDGRYAKAVEAGTGGLLQAITYVGGLSGGGIATTQLGIHGFPLLSELIANNNFNLTLNSSAFGELVGKAELGFPLTIADIFGIAAIYNGLIPFGGSTADPMSFTWSGIQAQPAFQKGSIPMSILMANEVVPPGVDGSNAFNSPNGTILLPTEGSNTVYEFTPFEFGSWTGRVQAFAELDYLGTTLYGGEPVNTTLCVLGYDAATFLGGITTAAINFWFAENESNGTVGQFAKRQDIPYPANEDTIEEERVAAINAPLVADLPEFASLLETTVSDILYALVTNPFYGYDKGVDAGASSQEELYLVDGSETGQLNPIWPLLQPERGLDFIIVSDNGGTELSSGWMNGTSLRNTYLAATTQGLSFPKIPSVNTMLNLNYTSKPVLYGCWEPEVPIVLYAADFPYTAYTNLSFIVTSVTNPQVTDLSNNGLALFSQDSNRLAEGWTQCIACAAIDRSLGRLGWARPEACENCFKKHCWDGTVEDSQPSFLEPALVLNLTLS